MTKVKQRGAGSSPGAKTANATSDSKGTSTARMKFSLQHKLSSGEDECQQSYDGNGNFKDDFLRLCRRKRMIFIPQIVPRPRPPYMLESFRRRDKFQRMDKGFSRKQIRQRTKMNEGRPVSPGNKVKVKVKVTVEVMVKVMVKLNAQEVNLTRARDEEVTAGEEAVDPALTFFQAAQPVTYTTKDRYRYFIPCIQVEREVPDDDTTVTEIYVRGWKVDAQMMGIFSACWPLLEDLRLVQLWNTGLCPSTFPHLASFLPQCLGLTTLVLDNNPLLHCPVSSLLDNDSLLEHLSLRFCELSDIEAASLGARLAQQDLPLLTLNLSNNKIGDQGVRGIAEGLRVNRNLLTLNLASNCVSDDGAAALSVALTLFPLSPEQMLERKSLLKKKVERDHARHMAMTFAKRFSNKDRLQSSGSLSTRTSLRESPKNSVVRKGGTKDPNALPRDKDNHKDRKISSRSLPKSFSASKSRQTKSETGRVTGNDSHRTKKKSASEFREKPSKARQRKKSDKVLAVVGAEAGESDPGVEEFYLSPLTDVSSLRDGQLHVPGNRTLISLNLSRNEIGERGVRALLGAVVEQGRPIYGCRQLSSGLKRLVIHRNAVREDSPVVQAIHSYMRLRDPFFHSPRVHLDRLNVTPCSLPFVV